MPVSAECVFSIVLVRYIRGYWLYGIFDVLTPVQTAGFLAVATGLFVALYFIAELANYLVWG